MNRKGSFNPREKLAVDTTSFAVEDEIQITDYIVANIGASVNFFNIKDQPGGGAKSHFIEFNPQIGIAYNPRYDLGFHFACGRKAAFPRMKDMYPVGQWNPMMRANFDLDPEHIFAMEMGIKKDFSKIGKIGFTLFRDEIDHMIESGPKPGGGMWMENKPDKRIVRGIEIDFDLNLFKHLFWGVNYCYLDTEEKSTDDEIVFRPRNSGNSYLRYIFNFGLTAQLDIDFSSKNRTKFIKKVVMPPPQPIFDYERLGGYTFLNLRLQQKFKDHYTAYLNITNLFDTDEEEGFCPRQRLKPLPGRMLTAGFSMKF
ncbi:MAG: TonB-dependent receptor [Thermodesulfobacteriota bacterium]|nr:TonB-dependent receptor [Thermodesulfobacteriota bacterium]